MVLSDLANACRNHDIVQQETLVIFGKLGFTIETRMKHEGSGRELDLQGYS